MAGSKITTDHDEIRNWAEERGGRPATVRSTHGKEHGQGHAKSGGTGIIRIEFPDAPNSKHDALEEISWEEFFEKFDESDLAFLHQDKTADGKMSRFHKFVSRDSVDEDESGSKTKDDTSKSKSKSSTRH
jgi:hypothetical protein